MAQGVRYHRPGIFSRGGIRKSVRLSRGGEVGSGSHGFLQSVPPCGIRTYGAVFIGALYFYIVQLCETDKRFI